MEGHGKFTYPDGRVYIGEYNNDKINGEGVFTWPNGRKYEGQYEDDKKHGYGIFQWADGRMYKGYWKMENNMEKENFLTQKQGNGGREFGKKGKESNGLMKIMRFKIVIQIIII